MKKERAYTIGEVGKTCGLSKNALRRYEKMGFELAGLNESIESGDYQTLKKAFTLRMETLREEEEQFSQRFTMMKDWYKLVVEAESVRSNNVTDISVKFVKEDSYCFYQDAFAYNYHESIVNVGFTNYIESIHNQTAGPVIIKFSCYKEKMRGKARTGTVMQRTIKKMQEYQQIKLGGKFMVSGYHIGPHETLDETYQRICDWAKRRGYNLEPVAYERYVADYWTLQDNSKFVTEVLMEVTCIN